MPNVHIQESKVASCDIQPGRRPTGPALLEHVADYQRRAGITIFTGNDQRTPLPEVAASVPAVRPPDHRGSRRMTVRDAGVLP